MNITEAIQNRRSIRKYIPGKSIPREHINQILTAAMMAPSAGNSRPWEFVVVEEHQTKEEITKVHPFCKSLPDASLAIVVCARPELQQGLLEGYWPQDCGAATENILLAAMDYGYGTCWCGVYPIQERVEALQKLLNITSTPVSLIIMGTPDEAPAARSAFDPEKVKYI